MRRNRLRRFARLAVISVVLAAMGSLAHAQSKADYAEADLMLDILRVAAHGPVPQGKIDEVMASPGMRMIVSQQNISREVSAEQYRTLLNGLHESELPKIKAMDESERARRGVG